MTQNQDDKVQTILYAAFDAFAKYGFKRTSMADIAEGADMSRAALYLHFKNKNDIFREMIETYYEMSCRDVSEALGKDGSIEQLLHMAFLAQTGDTFRALLDSPHGAEIIDMKSADRETVQQGLDKVLNVYAHWLTAQANVGRLSFAAIHSDPIEVALIMQRAMDGLKADVPSYDEFSKRRDALAIFLARGLAV